jgi:hypothetical protein
MTKLTYAQWKFLGTSDLMTGVCDEDGAGRTVIASCGRQGLIEWRKHPAFWGGLRDVPIITEAGRTALASKGK